MTLCECGCGQETSIIYKTNGQRGDVRGAHRRYLPYHHLRSAKDEDRYVVNLETGCWEFKGSKRWGYGMMQHPLKHKVVMAHRYFWEKEHGPVPDGLELDHLCRVRRCVNPSHLEPVTRRENIVRGVNQIARQVRQTHCKRGHLLEGWNILTTKTTARRCRECRKLYTTTPEYREKRRAYEERRRGLRTE